MRVQTFLGRVSTESMQQMEEHINDWLTEHNVEPKHIKQSFGYERANQSSVQEPVIVVTVWY
ncbi:MAG: hypothetical protein IT367_17175 [Candidatus Hydrogenedentes bacterium]|jgi:hypothetical protein|nr:hypothetical protein [Candidatus Hydrogenedentota bacterium]